MSDGMGVVVAQNRDEEQSQIQEILTPLDS